MKESDAIDFYCGLLKLVPGLKDLPKAERESRLGKAFTNLFSLKPTREHIHVATARISGNRIKRAWSLKYRYLVGLFLAQPSLPLRAANRIIKVYFNQRTRPTVIESAREDARKFPNLECLAFLQAVRNDYARFSKDPVLVK